MSNKEYHVFNVLFVALLICLFLVAFFSGKEGNFISCQVLEATGVECESCGLTRDFISFVHFDFKSTNNDQSIFVFFWFLLQLIFRIIIVSKPPIISQNLKRLDLIISICTAIFTFLPFWN